MVTPSPTRPRGTHAAGALVSLALLAGAAAAACVSQDSDAATAAQSPALGKADSTDRADRDCRVALRSIGRTPQGDDYETRCSDGACAYVWRGAIEVAEDVPADAGVYLLYHLGSDPSWWQVEATLEPTGQPGFRRHGFAVSEHLFGPEAGLGEGRAIELVAFARLPDGARLFDHNRFSRDFDNLRVASDSYFSSGDGGVCAPVVGTLSFHDNWEETRWGTLRQGGYLTVQYDIDRLPGCRGTHDGHPAWDVVAFARFLPGGQLLSGSVRGLVADMGTPTSEGVDLPWTTRIPADAEAVELWFQNHTGAGSSCQSWDSDFGRNYRAEVWPDAEHPRCRDVELETGIRTESELQAHNAPYCLGYDLAAQIDADHCEFHVDGFGNGHVGHYGFPYDWLVAYLRTGPQDGQVLAAGMFTRFHDVATGAPGQRFSLGVQVEPGLWRTGFAYHVLGMGGLQPADRVAEEMSFFIDVRRPSGAVVRLWHSRHGADYSWTDAFGLPTTSQGVPYGSVQWAHPDAAVLESRRACR